MWFRSSKKGQGSGEEREGGIRGNEGEREEGIRGNEGVEGRDEEG